MLIAKKTILISLITTAILGSFAVAAYAALDVEFSETIDVPVAGITLTISAGSIVDSITFNDNDLSVVLSNGASITINSADGRDLSTNPSTYTSAYDSSTCTDTFSSITISKNSAGTDRKSTRLNSSHTDISRMPSSA